MRRAWIVLALVGASTLAPRAASALSCVPLTTAAELDGAQAVFVGRVVKNVAKGDDRIVTFRVSEAFKGSRGDTLAARMEAGQKFFWTFPVGTEFLVFAASRPDDGATLWMYPCAGTLPLRGTTGTGAPLAAGPVHPGTADVLRELRELVAAKPGPPTLPPPAVEPAPVTSPPAPAPPEAPRPVTRTSGSGCSGCVLSGARDRTRGWGWLPFIVGAGGLVVRRRRRAAGSLAPCSEGGRIQAPFVSQRFL